MIHITNIRIFIQFRCVQFEQMIFLCLLLDSNSKYLQMCMLVFNIMQYVIAIQMDNLVRVDRQVDQFQLSQLLK